MNYFGWQMLLALALSVSACSDDDDPVPTPTPDPDPEQPTNKVEYVWGTDGGLKSCDHILFNEADNTENAEGTQIGNGDAEFVFTGKQTLKKGTYLLKGWVYIANGAELTIEPGTIIKGD